MGLALDFSRDQAIFDNLEAVTFTSVRTAGNVTASVDDATFDYVSLKEAAASNGVYRAGDVSFAIRQSLLENVGGAKPADTVTRDTDGLTYTVLTATPTVLTKVWDLVCRRLDLAADLDQVGTLSRPPLTQDAAGRPARTTAGYTTVTANIPCRVQPLGGDAADVNDKRTEPQRYTAFVAVALDARAGDRFTVGSTHYTVIATKNPERIDELPSLTLERVIP